MLNQKYNYRQDLQDLQERQDLQDIIKINQIDKKDLPVIARLYEETFSNHFLGHMGQDFLKLFCSQFMNSTTNFGYVAAYNDKPIGFLIGTSAKDPFMEFYRRNFLKLSLIVMKKFLTDPYVRTHINKRLGNIRLAVKSLLLSQKGVNNFNKSNSVLPARLLAIGVDPNYRGLGAANILTGQFCSDLKRNGISRVGLSVLPWNERAINFYKKDGWLLEENRETSLYFTKNT